MSNENVSNAEYIYHVLSDSLYYPKPLLFVTSDLLPKRTGFASIYAISKTSYEAIKRAGTVAGFAGEVWSERLWLDIDSYEVAESVELKLKAMGLDYVAYDSGSKGAHFGILREHAPSHLLPKKDRAWVTKHFPQADSSIYTPLHLFRLPNTTHEKTGRRKEIVSICEDKDKTRSIIFSEIEQKSLRSLPVISKGTSLEESLFKDARILQSIKEAKLGTRHKTLVTIAYALKDKGTDLTNALWFLHECNKLFPEAKSEVEVEKILSGIYEKP